MENSSFNVDFDVLFRHVDERFHVLKLLQENADSSPEMEDDKYPAMERIFPGYSLLHYEECKVKAREMQMDMEMEKEKEKVSDGDEPWWEGCVSGMALEPGGVRFFKERIEEGNPKYVRLILLELKDCLHVVMNDTFGKSLIQLIFQDRRNISFQQRDLLVYLIISDHNKLKDVCINNIGNQAMKIVLENITRPFTQYAVICALNHIIVPLMTNVNGSYVILHCVRIFSETLQKSILNGIARNIVEIATNEVGCSVIQKVLDNSGTIVKIKLVESIISNALLLAEDPFGNYVLQYVISSLARKRVIIELRGKFARLSMNKYGSTVLEELMKYSSENDVNSIIEEILTTSDFLDIVKDPFGNYVAQRALLCTQGPLHKKLCHLITICYEKELQGHPYGKNVLRLAMIYIENYYFFFKDFIHYNF